MTAALLMRPLIALDSKEYVALGLWFHQFLVNLQNVDIDSKTRASHRCFNWLNWWIPILFSDCYRNCIHLKCLKWVTKHNHLTVWGKYHIMKSRNILSSTVTLRKPFLSKLCICTCHFLQWYEIIHWNPCKVLPERENFWISTALWAFTACCVYPMERSIWSWTTFCFKPA